MSFHPRMYASVKGISAVLVAHNILFKDMVVDYWEVEAAPNASGNYVSMHPRIIIFFDDNRIALSQTRTGPFKECNICFIPPGLQLWGRILTAGRVRHLDIHLKRQTLSTVVGKTADLKSPFSLDGHKTLMSIADLVAAESCKPSRSRDHVRTLINALTLELFHHSAVKRSSSMSADWFEKIKKYVSANLEKGIPIDQLAREVDMSRTHFDRVFRERVKTSPHQWILQSRIARAKKLLRSGLPFAEVATKCGFADQAHFNRSFKAATGSAPGIWVRQHGLHASG